jgi:hypothetical protein
MSLYFSAAVWASLALCVCYSVEDHLPRYQSAIAQLENGHPLPSTKTLLR